MRLYSSLPYIFLELCLLELQHDPMVTRKMCCTKPSRRALNETDTSSKHKQRWAYRVPCQLVRSRDWFNRQTEIPRPGFRLFTWNLAPNWNPSIKNKAFIHFKVGTPECPFHQFLVLTILPIAFKLTQLLSMKATWAYFWPITKVSTWSFTCTGMVCMLRYCRQLRL